MLPAAGGSLFDSTIVRNNEVGLYSELNLPAQPRYQSIANIFHLYFQVRYKANTSFSQVQLQQYIVPKTYLALFFLHSFKRQCTMKKKRKEKQYTTLQFQQYRRTTQLQVQQ